MPVSTAVKFISSLESQLLDLTSLVIELVCKEAQQVKRCGAFTNNSYLTNRYPTSQYHTGESYIYGGFSSHHHGPSEPYSTYTPEWQPHPYLNEYEYDYNRYNPSYPSYGSTLPATQSYSGDSGMSLEEIVKSLALSILEFEQETRVSLQNLENQISRIDFSLRRLEVQFEEKLGPINKKMLKISLDKEHEKKHKPIYFTRCQ